MTTWPGAGTGSGRSSIARTSGPPYCVMTIARIAVSPRDDVWSPTRLQRDWIDKKNEVSISFIGLIYDGPHHSSAAMLRRRRQRGQLPGRRREDAAGAAVGVARGEEPRGAAGAAGVERKRTRLNSS